MMGTMREKACTVVTALLFALFMALSARDLFIHPRPPFSLYWKGCSLLLCGCCLALSALRRSLFSSRVCLRVLWLLALASIPNPFALMDGPGSDYLATYMPRLFAGVFASAIAYSLLCILAEKQRQAGTAANETPSGCLVRLWRGCLLWFVVVVVFLDLFPTLIDLPVPPTQP